MAILPWEMRDELHWISAFFGIYHGGRKKFGHRVDGEDPDSCIQENQISRKDEQLMKRRDKSIPFMLMVF